MKTLYFIAIAVFVVFSMAAVGPAWPPRPYPPPNAKDEIAADQNWTILPKADVFEVGASKMAWSSIRDMPPSQFRRLTPSEAKRYAGRHYSCPARKTPYLFRAVYRTGNGLGQFRAERNGNDVAIVFGDMPTVPPEDSRFEWSAVVVNLDFTPERVYQTISGFQ